VLVVAGAMAIAAAAGEVGGAIVLLGLVALQPAVGFAIGRWWALVLPFAWALVSLGAEGYDIPVTTQLLFQAPFLWIPALALGVALRRIAWPRLRPS